MDITKHVFVSSHRPGDEVKYAIKTMCCAGNDRPYRPCSKEWPCDHNLHFGPQCGNDFGYAKMVTEGEFNVKDAKAYVFEYTLLDGSKVARYDCSTYARLAHDADVVEVFWGGALTPVLL